MIPRVNDTIIGSKPDSGADSGNAGYSRFAVHWARWLDKLIADGVFHPYRYRECCVHYRHPGIHDWRETGTMT